MGGLTPGEWRLVRRQRKLFVLTNADTEPFTGQVVATETTAPESAANLRAIAALPAVLAALERVVGEAGASLPPDVLTQASSALDAALNEPAVGPERAVYDDRVPERLLRVEYDDAADMAQYPIQDWHRRSLCEIMRIMVLPQATSWSYVATAQGRVFGCDISKPQVQRLSRLYRTAMTQLRVVPGFRWISVGNRGLSVGLTHELPGDQEALT